MTPDTILDPDAELVRQAAQGDRHAFDVLVRRYESQIFNLARAMTRGDDEADDLAQEAFVRAYRAIRSFRGDSLFRTWLYQVTVNVVRTHLSSRSRWRRLWSTPVEAGADEDGDAAALATPGFEDDVVRRDTIDRALAGLPEDLRVAVTLRDIQGLDYREIAETLQVPMGTVESRIFRARQRLRTLLAPLLGRGAGAPALARPAVAAGDEG
ncbi:MAG: sigma-70 family RNA polymerase sigma factor [Acidobacteria bacterium]|nr:sigma-70 family RNA polymerase sigma factor [Acidobacteriota bacterium]